MRTHFVEQSTDPVRCFRRVLLKSLKLRLWYWVCLRLRRKEGTLPVYFGRLDVLIVY